MYLKYAGNKIRSQKRNVEAATTLVSVIVGKEGFDISIESKDNYIRIQRLKMEAIKGTRLGI